MTVPATNGELELAAAASAAACVSKLFDGGGCVDDTVKRLRYGSAASRRARLFRYWVGLSRTTAAHSGTPTLRISAWRPGAGPACFLAYSYEPMIERDRGDDEGTVASISSSNIDVPSASS